jgi:palmitoyltransferase
MNTTRAWHRALHECGYDVDGNAKNISFGLNSLIQNKSTVSKFFLFWPFLVVFVAVYILSHMVIYAAVPIMVVSVYSMQWIAQQVANRGPMEYRLLQKTVCESLISPGPLLLKHSVSAIANTHQHYMAGIFAGSLFWVGVRYVTKVLPSKSSSSNP